MANDGPFLCYRELIPPTSIATSTFFICEDLEYLLTATACVVRVYRVHNRKLGDSSLPFLSQCCQLAIFGKPHDVRVFSVSKSTQHIVLTVDVGKIIILAYDPIKGSLYEYAKFNAEENSIGVGAEVRADGKGSLMFPGNGTDPYLEVSKDGAVACVLMCSSQLFFLPLNDPASQVSIATSKPFIVDLLGDLLLVGPVVDFCFLDGFSRPTIAVLQEAGPLPVGHAAQVMHTCILTVLAVDLCLKTAALVWQQPNLPHDCIRLLAVPNKKLESAVIVISMNALLVVAFDGVFGMATNGFASLSVHPDFKIQSWPSHYEGLELDASRWIACDKNSIVGSLKNGKMLAVHLHLSPDECPMLALRFEAELLCSTVIASTFSRSVRGDLWFLGSVQSDSLLLQVTMQTPLDPSASGALESEPSGLWTASNPLTSPGPSMPPAGMSSILKTPNINNSMTGLTSASKRIRRSGKGPQRDPSEVMTSDTVVDLIGEEVVLYGTQQQKPSSSWLQTLCADSKLSIEIVDVIAALGPVINGTFTSADDALDLIDKIDWTSNLPQVKPGTVPAASYIAPREARESLLLSCSMGDTSSLNKISFGLKVNKIAAREFPDATSCFCVPLLAADATGSSMLFLSFPDRTRVFLCREKLVPSTAGAGISSGDVTIKELSSAVAGFVLTQPTLSVSSPTAAPSSSVIVLQVCAVGVRVVQVTVVGEEYSASPLQDSLVSDELDLGGLGGMANEIIVGADIVQESIVVLTSTSTVHVLEYDFKDQYLGLKNSINAEDERDGSKKRMASMGDELDSTMVLEDIGSIMRQSSTDSMPSTSSALRSNAALPVSVSLFLGVFPSAVQSSSAAPSLFGDVGSSVVKRRALSFSSPSTPRTPKSHHKATLDRVDEEAVDSDEINPVIMAAEETLLYGSIQDPDATIEPADDAATSDRLLSLQTPVRGSSSSSRSSRGKRSLAQAQSPAPMDEEQTDPIVPVAELYVVIGYSSGTVLVRRVRDDVCVFSSSEVTQLADFLPLRDSSSSSTSTSTPSLNLESGRHICDVRLERLNSVDGPQELSRLCLTVLFEAGDVAVYYAIENEHHGAAFFRKLEHHTILHNPRGKGLRAKRYATPEDPVVVRSDSKGLHHQVLSDEELQYYRLHLVHNFQGRRGVLIPGPLPYLLIVDKGMPNILPICLPELPFSNSGRYAATPLSIGTISGVVTLWQENLLADDVFHSRNKSQLGLYQCGTGSSTMFPGGSVTSKRVSIPTTINFLSELLPKSDDKTETALLQKKTFVAACAETVELPFVSSVLTDAEIENEEKLYDRFLEKLISFKQPDPAVGAAPKLVSQQHKLVLLQGGACVDEYPLDQHEHVLGVEVLYLSVEKKADAAVANLVNNAIGRSIVTSSWSKRVFIAVCTGVQDKHGEDTQGEGRLLLFNLEYKVVQPTNLDVKSSAATAEGTTDSEDNPTQSTSSSSSSATPTPPPVAKLEASNMQTQFLHSINPKLHLLSKGPGPASVVKQFGENILSTVGPRVYIYRLNSETLCLDQVSFFYAQFYVSSVSIAKNYIMLCDVCNSVQFLVWRDEDCSLTLLSKDHDKHVCLSSAFLWDGPALGLCVSDNEANLQVLQYCPRKVESKQGSRLLTMADFHLGSDCNVLLTHVLPSPLQPMAAPLGGVVLPKSRKASGSGKATASQGGVPFASIMDKMASNRSCVVTATTDGSLGVLVPLDERMYRRLALLQQIMCMGVQTAFALNAKEYRVMKVTRVLMSTKRGILDGALLWKFGCLPAVLQDELATVVGTTRDVILENLSRLDRLMSFF